VEPYRILLVEDEARMRELVRLYLEREGYEIEEAPDGRRALTMLQEKDYQLVILDIMLPELDGWTICRQIRRHRDDLPIIIITARGDELDRLLGFDLGADDYVVKPFSPRELVARVKALLRRSGGLPRDTGDELVAPGLKINTSSRVVLSRGQAVNLTPKEFDLLTLLVQHPDKVFTREQLLEKVWGYDFFGDTRTVDTHIKNLREKLRQRGETATGIKTIWGVGYKFETGDTDVEK
jgi:two-component system response regulator ResD